MPASIQEHLAHLHIHSGADTPDTSRITSETPTQPFMPTSAANSHESPLQLKTRTNLKIQITSSELTTSPMLPLPLTPSFVKSKFVAAVMDLPSQPVSTTYAASVSATHDEGANAATRAEAAGDAVLALDGGKSAGALRAGPDFPSVPVAGPSLAQPLVPLPTAQIDLPVPILVQTDANVIGSGHKVDAKTGTAGGSQLPHPTIDATSSKAVSTYKADDTKESTSATPELVEAPLPLPLPHPEFVAELLAKGVSSRPVFSQLWSSMPTVSTSRSKSSSAQTSAASIQAARTALTDAFDTVVALIGHGCRLDPKNRDSMTVFAMVPSDALSRIARCAVRLGLVRWRGRNYVIRSTLRAQLLPLLWKTVPRFSPQSKPGICELLASVTEKSEAERKARESNRIGAKNPTAPPKIKFTRETAPIGMPNQLAGRNAAIFAAGMMDTSTLLALQESGKQGEEGGDRDDDNFGAGYESFDGPPPEVDADALAVTDIILDLVCSYIGQDKFTASSPLPIRGNIVPLLGSAYR